jgi:hypothetical protein
MRHFTERWAWLAPMALALLFAGLFFYLTGCATANAGNGSRDTMHVTVDNEQYWSANVYVYCDGTLLNSIYQVELGHQEQRILHPFAGRCYTVSVGVHLIGTDALNDWFSESYGRNIGQGVHLTIEGPDISMSHLEVW